MVFVFGWRENSLFSEIVWGQFSTILHSPQNFAQFCSFTVKISTLDNNRCEKVRISCFGGILLHQLSKKAYIFLFGCGFLFSWRFLPLKPCLVSEKSCGKGKENVIFRCNWTTNCYMSQNSVFLFFWTLKFWTVSGPSFFFPIIYLVFPVDSYFCPKFRFFFYGIDPRWVVLHNFLFCYFSNFLRVWWSLRRWSILYSSSEFMVWVKNFQGSFLRF